jgi:hypothetical protein
MPGLTIANQPATLPPLQRRLDDTVQSLNDSIHLLDQVLEGCRGILMGTGDPVPAEAPGRSMEQAVTSAGHRAGDIAVRVRELAKLFVGEDSESPAPAGGRGQWSPAPAGGRGQ